VDRSVICSRVELDPANYREMNDSLVSRTRREWLKRRGHFFRRAEFSPYRLGCSLAIGDASPYSAFDITCFRADS
jgi:hypothetical protein